MLNKRGLRRLPWGTPQRIGVQLEQLLLHITLCFRSCKNDLSSLRAVSRRPYAFNFASSRLWQIQSKALDKSIATTPTSCFSSRDFLQSSVSFIWDYGLSEDLSMFILRSPMNIISFRLAYIFSAAVAHAGINSVILHFPGEDNTHILETSC